MPEHTSYDIIKMKTELSSVVEDLPKSYTLLREFTGSDSVEILFYHEKECLFHDKIKGTKLETKYLEETSLLGRAFLHKKAFAVQNVTNSSRFTLAIDNPFKIEIRAQVVLPVVLDNRVEGIVRFSKCDAPYAEKEVVTIKQLMNTFKDIFLYEHHVHDMEVLRHPFTLDKLEVYKSLKETKTTFETLLKHTENPEIQKLLGEVQTKVDSIFRYLNPNMDNVSKIKNELREFNKYNKKENSLKILIADDVLMNVRILDSMLNHDDDIRQILTAYDGNETMEVLEQEMSEGDPIDILLLDHHMPGKMGLEIAETLKSDARYHNTIIVSITNDPEAIKHRAELYNYQVSKPFSKSAIDQMLDDVKQTRINSDKNTLI